MQSKIEYIYFIIIFQPNKSYIFFNLEVRSVRSALEMLMCLMSVFCLYGYILQDVVVGLTMHENCVKGAV